MSIALQILINSIIAGAIYALVASGFSLIYSVCRFVHFAHGAAIAFSAYILYFLFSVIGLDFGFAALLAVASASLIGFAMNVLVYKQLRKRRASPAIMLIAGFALLILFESMILILFGADIKTIGLIKAQKGLEIAGAIITPLQASIVFVSIALLGVFLAFMKRTKTGKAMRAVADNKDVAEVVGISSERIYTYAFVIGSAIAGIAAVLVGLEQNIEPMMGTHLMIKGFTGAVIGGIGSVPGAIMGSFLLGFAENFGIWFLPSGYKDAIAFVILLIFLLFRPRGILGIRGGEG